MLRPAVLAPGIEETILDTLARRVHVLSLEQLAGAWWGRAERPLDAARRRLNQFVATGKLIQQTALARPFSFLVDRPVLTWEPPEPDPDFEATSYRLKDRWAEPHRETVVYTASRQTGFRLGGFSGPIKHPDQVTHDLLLAQVYLFCLKNHPLVASHWVGEECYRDEHRGEKIPDAKILDDATPPNVALVIESGGEYDASRVDAFHRSCKEKALPYQLW